MAQSTHIAIRPITPSEPREPNIAVMFATTLMSDGMNGILPSPRTSSIIAKAAMLTPTSASDDAQPFTLLRISIEIPSFTLGVKITGPSDIIYR